MKPHQLSAQLIAWNQCTYFENRYPALKALDLTVRPETADAVCQIYVEHIKLMDSMAADLSRMEIYRRLVELPPESGLRTGPARALARLYADRGLAYHALKLVEGEDPQYADFSALMQEHAEHYGLDFDIQFFAGLSRGCCLLHYFSAHTDLLKNRRIAHIGPEKELRQWIADMSQALGCQYVAIDGFQPNMDRYEDLCSMTIDDESFDTIICHRVLEHVIDGPSAYRELFRILKPGGVLNYSVPEALYLEKTSEWVVPDPKFHGHVRTYGRDFPNQLRELGFRVERADWLLRRPFDELKAVRAYPMLMYNAYKD